MVEKTGRPGYLQIADDLRTQIRTGALAPGTALPSTAQLCQRYDVSASVVKAAISVLRTEGLIVGQQGKGVFVREGAAASATAPGEHSEEFRVISEQLRELRQHVEKLTVRLDELDARTRPDQAEK
jgi:DNA-binding GntR family transcriptional regulator